MTSISGSMSTAAMVSPNDRMKLALQSAVSAGTVQSADQSALSGALDDIDTAMKAGASSTTGTGPGKLQSKVSSLIDDEVTNGKLTSDQATELKKVFADASQQMGGAGGPGGPRGAGGPPPPPPGGATDSSDDDSSSSTSTTSDSTSAGSTDSTTDSIEKLISFLKQLEQAVQKNANYTASGNSSSTSLASSMLVNSDA